MKWGLRGAPLLDVQYLDAFLIRWICYAGTEWRGFRILSSFYNLLYQVINAFHIASLPNRMASPTYRWGTSFTGLRKENYFGEYVKMKEVS